MRCLQLLPCLFESGGIQRVLQARPKAWVIGGNWGVKCSVDHKEAGKSGLLLPDDSSKYLIRPITNAQVLISFEYKDFYSPKGCKLDHFGFETGSVHPASLIWTVLSCAQDVGIDCTAVSGLEGRLQITQVSLICKLIHWVSC